MADGSDGKADETRSALRALVFVTPEELNSHQSPSAALKAPPARPDLPDFPGAPAPSDTPAREASSSELFTPSSDEGHCPASDPPQSAAPPPVEPRRCPRCETAMPTDTTLYNCTFCGYFIGDLNHNPPARDCVLETVKSLRRRRRVDKTALVAASVVGLLFCAAVTGIFSSLAEVAEVQLAPQQSISIALPEVRPETRAAARQRTQKPPQSSTERIQSFIEMVKALHGEQPAKPRETAPLQPALPEAAFSTGADSFALTAEQTEQLFPESAQQPEGAWNGLWECTRYGEDGTRITNNPNAGVDVDCVPSMMSNGSFNKLRPGQSIGWY